MTWSELMLGGLEEGCGMGWSSPSLVSSQPPSSGIRTVQYIIIIVTASLYQALTKYRLHIQKS